MRFFKQLRDPSDADTLDETSDPFSRPSCRQVRLAWRGPRPCVEYGIHDRLERPQGQSPQYGVLLGSQRSPRSRRAAGVGGPGY
jgi:hypothetical protein